MFLSLDVTENEKQYTYKDLQVLFNRSYGEWFLAGSGTFAGPGSQCTYMKYFVLATKILHIPISKLLR